MHSRFWLGSQKERNHVEVLDIDEMLIVSVILKVDVVRAWTGFSCLRIRTSGGML
jgi:hypothetical protein